jgi:TP901 family phage tail tape measure protein
VAVGKNRILVALGLKFDDSTLDHVRQRIAGLQSNLARTGERFKRFGEGAERVGRSLTGYVSAPLLLAGGAIAKVGGDFEAAMNVLEVKSGAVGAELVALRERAKELGATTQFTAAQAAEGMIEFAKAGLRADQVLQVIGPALDFAVSAQMGLGEVAALTANTLSQFSLEADRAVDVADFLSKAAGASTTTVQDLGEALTYAGSSASAVGMDLRETSAVLAAMANVGIKGSMAGTALANAMIRLAAPSKSALATLKKLGIAHSDYVDSAGRMKKPLQEFLAALNRSGASIGDLVEIFDQRAARAFVGLVGDTSKLAATTDALADAEGNAAKQAAVMMKGFQGALKSLRSAVEGLAIAIADTGLLKFFTRALDGITKLVRGITNLNPRLLRTITIIGGIAALIGPILIGVGLAAKAFGMLAKSAAAGWLAVAAPWLLAIGAVAALYLIVDDFIAWLQGRPSFIGHLLRDVEFQKLEEFRKYFRLWMREIYETLYPKKVQTGSIFAGILADMVKLIHFTMKLIRILEKASAIPLLSSILPGGAARARESSARVLDSVNKPPVGSFARPNISGSTRARESSARVLDSVNNPPVGSFARPNMSGSTSTTRQTISPTINVSITKPGSTTDDILTAIRRETANMFGDLAIQLQPPLAQ